MRRIQSYFRKKGGVGIFIVFVVILVGIFVGFAFLGGYEMKCKRQLTADKALTGDSLRDFSGFSVKKEKEVVAKLQDRCPLIKKKYVYIWPEPEYVCPYHGIAAVSIAGE